jgi:hypothetical protein
MAKKKRPAAPLETAAAPPVLSPHLIWPAFALLAILFFWTPLFDDQASIQWDMADVHYSAQKYFEQSLRTTGLPRWTPFEFSGMPFLADPQTGAWYPLHWPFFLIGITPRAMQWELALHAFLALGGMFLLARKVTRHTGGAVVAAVFYAFSGFFAGHSSHLGIFETAALLPWLLWGATVAIETGATRDILVTGLIAGVLILIGHFQTALYAFFALALLAALSRGSIARRALVLAVAAAVGLLISAVQTLPALELASQSNRATASYRADTNAANNPPVKPAALATLVRPDFYGVISGDYKGPGDITQSYFYGGLLLLPLVIAAFVRRTSIAIPAVLIAVPLWYSLGPKTGLYDALTLLPGFGSVRAPVHIWFVVALGLALAAGLGFVFVAERFRKPWLAAAVIAFSLGDLWYWNMSSNPLTYARMSYAERYGNAFDNYQAHIAAARQRPFYRIWSPYATNAFGPLNSALESRTEVTYGYNPLELARYGDYLHASEQNPKLLNGLAVTHKIDVPHGAIVENPDALPRVSVPPSVTFAPNADAAKNLLTTLDPAQSAVIEGPPRPLSPVAARVQIVNYEDDFYRIRYSAAGETLLRIAVPYFPGWSALIDGRPADVLPVDYALSGVVVPAGDHELTLRYRSRGFTLGAALSGITAIMILGFVLGPAFPGSVFRRRSR